MGMIPSYEQYEAKNASSVPIKVTRHFTIEGSYRGPLSFAISLAVGNFVSGNPLVV